MKRPALRPRSPTRRQRAAGRTATANHPSIKGTNMKHQQHRSVATPSGLVVSTGDLRVGDEILVWTHTNPEAPRRTWGPVELDSRRYPVSIDLDDYTAQQAVICRIDGLWHKTAAKRGINLGAFVNSRPHNGTGPPPWPDGTVDVAMPRDDLADALTLALIDNERGSPFNLDPDDMALDDNQLEHLTAAANQTARHLAHTPWPPKAAELGPAIERHLPATLRRWRNTGHPIHIKTLRRLARELDAVPHPDHIASHDLKSALRAGDRLDVYITSKHDTGLPAHAAGIGQDGRYPGHVAELGAEWWYDAYRRGHAVGTHLADTDNHTVLAAMTADDFEASIAAARNDHKPQGPARDLAVSALASLQRQYDDVRAQSASTDEDHTAAHTADNNHANQPKASIDIGL